MGLVNSPLPEPPPESTLPNPAMPSSSTAPRQKPTRCFLGFELTESSRRYLEELLTPWQGMLEAEAGWPVRLVPPENWHTTLLFFKGLEPDQRDAVWAEVARSVASGVWRGLRFDWSGLAVWPSHRRPGLICLEAPLHASAADWPLTGRLAQHPFSQGDGHHLLAYRPHITVMRFRRGGAAGSTPPGRSLRLPSPPEIAERMAALPVIDPARVTLAAVSFFLSTVSPERPIYPREHTLSLA